MPLQTWEDWCCVFDWTDRIRIGRPMASLWQMGNTYVIWCHKGRPERVKSVEEDRVGGLVLCFWFQASNCTLIFRVWKALGYFVSFRVEVFGPPLCTLCRMDMMTMQSETSPLHALFDSLDKTDSWFSFFRFLFSWCERERERESSVSRVCVWEVGGRRGETIQSVKHGLSSWKIYYIRLKSANPFKWTRWNYSGVTVLTFVFSISLPLHTGLALG